MAAQLSGKEARELMEVADMRPAGFADFLGVSMSTLSNIFRDKPLHKNTRKRVGEAAATLRVKLKTSA